MPASNEMLMADRGPVLAKLFASIDAMDTAGFLAKLSSHAVFRFGSMPMVQGTDAIGAAVDAFFATIAGISHEILNEVEAGTMLACEGQVTYTRHDATTVTLPFADFFEFDGELISAYRIYIDIGPLYATTP